MVQGWGTLVGILSARSQDAVNLFDETPSHVPRHMRAMHSFMNIIKRAHYVAVKHQKRSAAVRYSGGVFLVIDGAAIQQQHGLRDMTPSLGFRKQVQQLSFWPVQYSEFGDLLHDTGPDIVTGLKRSTVEFQVLLTLADVSEGLGYFTEDPFYLRPIFGCGDGAALFSKAALSLRPDMYVEAWRTENGFRLLPALTEKVDSFIVSSPQFASKPEVDVSRARNEANELIHMFVQRVADPAAYRSEFYAQPHG